MHRTTLDLQYYVPRAGDQVFAPPFTLDKEDMLVFVLKADRAKLNTLLDRELNEPWERAFDRRGLHHRYEAKADLVVVALSHVDELYPAVFEGVRAARAGGQAELVNTELQRLQQILEPMSADMIEMMSDVSADQREMIVMVPIQDVGPDPDASLPPNRTTSQWYLPIVLNDLAPAVLAGRELFGYPKVLATFSYDGKPASEGRLLENGAAPWHTLSIKTHAPVKREEKRADEPGYKRDYTSDEKPDDKPDAAAPAAAQPTSKYTLGLVEVVKLKRDENTRAARPAEADSLAQQAQALFTTSIEFLFLRQFRDPEYQRFASYQAAVIGSVTAPPGLLGELQREPEPNPEHYCFEFPTFGAHYIRLVDALGIDDAQTGVIPGAVFKLEDAKLIVTRGQIEWDRS